MIYVPINEIAIFNELPVSKEDFKYFIGYKDNKALCILLAKHKTYFDKNKYTCLMI